MLWIISFILFPLSETVIPTEILLFLKLRCFQVLENADVDALLRSM